MLTLSPNTSIFILFLLFPPASVVESLARRDLWVQDAPHPRGTTSGVEASWNPRPTGGKVVGRRLRRGLLQQTPHLVETVDPPDLSLSGTIPLVTDDDGMGTTSTFIFEAIPTIAPTGETDVDDLDDSMDWSDILDLEDVQHDREEDAAEEAISDIVWEVVLISGIVWGGLIACVTCLYRLIQGRVMEMILGIMLGIGWGGLIIFSTGFILVGFIVGVVITALAVGIGSQQKIC